MQIKYLCAGAKEKRFSMLKYAKELFEITKEEGMARNIIAMLFERNETNYAAYAPYIKVLSSSTKPDYCMAVASAMLRLGKTEEADLYAYKALYCLNQHGPYVRGYTRVTMVGTEGRYPVRGCQSRKPISVRIGG